MDVSGLPAELLRAVSINRLEPYVSICGDARRGLSVYLWNVSLCEAMYPALHCCEIALRNSMYETLSEHFGNRDWIFDRRYLVKRDGDTIAGVMRRLEDYGKPLTPDNVMAELTLGFWSTMLSASYDARYWRSPGLLRRLFPNAPRSELNIARLHRQLNHLRNFRNRIFHQEPVWNRSDLARNRDDCYRFAEWISVEWSNRFRKIDRFDEIYLFCPVI
ncbi:Abi family protein [bacterium]|nr:Abi family protein [bacterium]